MERLEDWVGGWGLRRVGLLTMGSLGRKVRTYGSSGCSMAQDLDFLSVRRRKDCNLSRT